MQFDLTQDFPVGLDRLWSALGNADYVRAKYRALGSTDIRLMKFSAGTDLIEVEVERLAPVAREQLPAWARLFAGTQQAMRQLTRWQRIGASEVAVAIDIAAPGLPVRAQGAGTVRELSPALVRMTLQFDVAGESAVLNASVARVFAAQVRHALQADHAFTLAYLRGTP